MSETAFAARHTMDSPEWYSPSAVVEAARTLMGKIDLDPASHEEANGIVKARRFFSIEDSGLKQSWSADTVFINPPGGLVGQFWKMALNEQSRYGQLIWIGYSLEQLQTLQNVSRHTPLHFAMCVPSRRMAFIENAAKKVERLAKIDAENEQRRLDGRKLKARNEKADSPSHGNYITYMGRDANLPAFASIFVQFGTVVLR